MSRPETQTEVQMSQKTNEIAGGAAKRRTTVALTLRLPVEVHDTLAWWSAMHSISISEAVRRAVLGMLILYGWGTELDSRSSTTTIDDMNPKRKENYHDHG